MIAVTRNQIPTGYRVAEPSMRLRTVLITALLSLAVVGEVDAQAKSSGTAAAKAAAASFLSHYVLPTGRVQRLDQGGDTVSAGQAYGLLLSEAVGKRGTFALIWRWTQAHLTRPGGLLASHWSRGRVVDPKSASDADLDAARALILAGSRFHIAAYRQAGMALGRAVLAHETERLGRSLVLLAGSWARKPAVVDPGYWAPRTFELLAAATHDQRFARLEQGAVSLAAGLAANAAQLPPDWATVSPAGVPKPLAGPPGPTHEATPRYSLDAARLPVRFAEACDARSKRLSAAIWPFFSGQPPDEIGFAYSLTGQLLAPEQSPVVLVGAAAAAQAAGQTAARDKLLAQADAINSRFPTYFGSAWIALGRVGLQTTLLGSCS